MPVIRRADQMNFAQIEKTINTLGKKANDGSISIDDMAGGTFTISNGGVYGSLISTPIINPPQVDAAKNTSSLTVQFHRLTSVFWTNLDCIAVLTKGVDSSKVKLKRTCTASLCCFVVSIRSILSPLFVLIIWSGGSCMRIEVFLSIGNIVSEKGMVWYERKLRNGRKMHCSLGILHFLACI